MMIIISIWVLCGVFAVIVAIDRGRKSLGAHLLLTFLGPIGLVSELMRKKKVKTHCPYCDELVDTEENTCSLCGLGLEEAHEGTDEAEETTTGRQCPTCGKNDVHDAYLEDGSWGKWCPNCKMSVKKMRKNCSAS